ncbi:MAG: dUTP diphosphatase [Candidatus Woesearchaeota archaeon]
MAKVKVVNKADMGLPKYHTQGSAGMDVHSAEDLILKKGEIRLISTGLYMAFPEGYELHIRPRSGLAFKHGITVLNSPATIDSDYRGELKVLLINHGGADFGIRKGDRIAQIVLNKFESIEWEPVDELDDTERKSGSFGSTGV